jgi:FG-GAP-like repeat/FG-GAP repeat
MLFQKERLRVFVLTMTLVVPLGASAAHAATVTIKNIDAIGVGFNDTTPATPVGGNTGTTIGAQRLNAIEFAGKIWGSILVSNVTIEVSASFAPLDCSELEATLGSAGPYTAFRNFTNAPVADTWYPVALANALSGTDLDPLNSDITARFNGAIGTTCLFPQTWYYGLDAKPGSGQTDFVTVSAHELAHGLGFLSFVNLKTGAKFFGFNDTYMRNLVNNGASPPDYPSMTDAQRVAASIATGNLLWVGANVQSWSSGLTEGAVGTRVRMYAPNPAVVGSSVSHWDTVLTPNQVMEPSYTVPLHKPRIEQPLFRDIGWTVPSGDATHDFNADGISDIVWRDTSGNVAVWLMNGVTATSTGGLGLVPLSSSIVGQRSFSSSDVTYDLLWRDTSGNTSIWFMNGTTVASAAGVGSIPANWSVAATGDFNGDGIGDILWQDNSGNLVVWLMSDSSVAALGPIGALPPAWTVAGAGDFNNDGRADILFRDTSGNTAIWFMNGTMVLSALSVGNIPISWSVVGTGDFNGDGSADILWRDTSGNVSIWLMAGASVLSTGGLGNVPLSFSIASTGDYNGDGKTDLLWRDTSGNTSIWFMNGTTVSSTGSVGNIPTTWTVQSVNAE